VKQKPDGSVDCYKARLVTKGFDQTCGINYHETFSPVVKPTSIRLILALAVQFDWHVKQLDVSNAFLHGYLDEEVYMVQPQGFIDYSHPDYVCHLHKSIYGLKRALRAWFNRLSTALLELGFIGSQVDHSLFIYHVGTTHMFLLVYVDDIIVTSNHASSVDWLVDKLKADFAMKDLDALHYFLDVQVIRTTAGLHLCQSKYVVDLLCCIKMDEAKPYDVPCPIGLKMSRFDGEVLSNPTTFHHVVGALQYATLTRPDLAYSVNQLCQHMHQPTTVHWTAAKRVLRYLKGSIDYGLFFSKGPLELHAYCDLDWVGNPDNTWSTTGFGIFIGTNLISWAAKKQHIVSRSSTEVEYRSMALATANLFWICMLLKELRISLLTPPHL
jgi:hypothetical protein